MLSPERLKRSINPSLPSASPVASSNGVGPLHISFRLIREETGGTAEKPASRASGSGSSASALAEAPSWANHGSG